MTAEKSLSIFWVFFMLFSNISKSRCNHQKRKIWNERIRTSDLFIPYFMAYIQYIYFTAQKLGRYERQKRISDYERALKNTSIKRKKYLF